MTKYRVRFISVSHKQGERIFENVDDVLAFLDKYIAYQVDILYEGSEEEPESYDAEHFVQLYENL